MSRKTIAIAGYHGLLGVDTLAAFVSAQFGNYYDSVRVLTRDPMNVRRVSARQPVLYLLVDYNDPESLDSALEGVDVLVNLIGFCPHTWDVLAYAAARARVRLYIPSEYDLDHSRYTPEPELSAKEAHAQRARSWGLKTVQLFCGILMEPAMTNHTHFGIMLSSRRIEAVMPQCGGRTDPKISFTSTKDVGMAIASISRHEPRQLADRIVISGDACTLRELAETWGAITRHSVQLAVRPLETYDAGGDIAKQRRLAAGKGYLDLARQHAGWVNNGEWKWTRISQYLAGDLA